MRSAWPPADHRIPTWSSPRRPSAGPANRANYWSTDFPHYFEDIRRKYGESHQLEQALRYFFKVKQSQLYSMSIFFWSETITIAIYTQWESISKVHIFLKWNNYHYNLYYMSSFFWSETITMIIYIQCSHFFKETNSLVTIGECTNLLCATFLLVYHGMPKDKRPKSK